VDVQCLPWILQPGHPGSFPDSLDGVIRFHIGASVTDGDRGAPSSSTSSISIYDADNEQGPLLYLAPALPSFFPTLFDHTLSCFVIYFLVSLLHVFRVSLGTPADAYC